MSRRSARVLYRNISAAKDVNEPDKLGNILLCDAVRAGEDNAVVQLVALGAGVNIIENRFTPLQLAVDQKRTSIVPILISSGADPYMETNRCESPVVTAVLNKCDEMVSLLLQCGVDPDRTCDTGYPLLSHAAGAGNVRIINILIAGGANVNFRSKHHGDTPLHIAVYNGHCDLALALIQHGARINMRCYSGHTPLHEALLRDDRDIGLLLIKHGATLYAEDLNGKTPLDLLSAGADFRQELIDAYELRRREPWSRKEPVKFDNAQATIFTTLACAKRQGLRLPLELWHTIFSHMNRCDFGVSE